MPRPLRTVVFLAYDGLRLLDVIGPLEVFTAANEAGADYRVLIASADGADVVASSGTRLGADLSFSDLPAAIDSVIVPGGVGWADSIAQIEVIELVRTAAQRSRRTVSVCAGAFLLAAAGLLDGRRATTHWRYLDELATRFPAVDVQRDAIFVQDTDVYTSAGVTTGIDLSLALVEQDHGPTLAREVARYLVVFMQRPGGQAQFSTRLAMPLVADEPLRSLLDAITSDPAGDHRLQALSARSGFSARHLSRVFRRELNQTPAEYVQHTRVETAKALLENSTATLATIASRSGLGSVETLRRAFLRELSITPNAYRRRSRRAAGGS